MKIVIDSAIPFIHDVFEPYAEVRYIFGPDIRHEDLLDADAFITRTRTRCDKALLAGTAVKMIASATIGIDHIDQDFCREAGIYVQNAAGCNAGGVMNYVFSALYGVAARKGINLQGQTIGIIGVGNVGRRVESMALSLGFSVLKNDPPRAAAEGSSCFCPLDELLAKSDIVTMHVPLNDSTRGMADALFFEKMRENSVFINAARGEVVVDEALKNAIPKFAAVVIDTWNNEPHPDPELIGMVDIATPHIAGYSYQGKQNGTTAAVRSVARFFKIEPLYDFFPSAALKELEAVKLDFRGKSQGEVASMMQYNYPVFTDDFLFRSAPDHFDRLRAEYQYRREFFVD